MSNVHVVSHPLVQHKLTLMRDKTVSTKGFRQLMNEIGMLLAYEVTRDLPLEMVEVRRRSPRRCRHDFRQKAGVGPILRAGVGFLDGMLDLVPNARVAHIGLYRDPQTLEAVEYYFKAPADVADRLVIVMDPMLATANSAVAAIDRLKRRGVKEIRFVCLSPRPRGSTADQGASRRADSDRSRRRTAQRARLHHSRPGRRGRPHVRHEMRAPRLPAAPRGSAKFRLLPCGEPGRRTATSSRVLLTAPALLAKAHLLGQRRARLGVGGSDHGIIRRKTPFLPVLFGGQVVLGPQMPLQRFELTADLFQADDVDRW